MQKQQNEGIQVEEYPREEYTMKSLFTTVRWDC